MANRDAQFQREKKEKLSMGSREESRANPIWNSMGFPQTERMKKIFFLIKLIRWLSQKAFYRIFLFAIEMFFRSNHQIGRKSNAII